MENCVRHMKSGSPDRFFGYNFGDLLKKISVNSTDVNGQTLLHHAVKLKKLDYITILLFSFSRFFNVFSLSAK